MSKKVDFDQSYRLANLDFLRGCFIILALEQHFTSYINMWYVEYFRDAIALDTTYAGQLPLLGKQISSDGVLHWLAVVFTPWVSQIYLTLATFNLARRSPDEMREVLGEKLKVLGLIGMYFVMENLIVAPNLGQGLSFYPVMLWMMILGLIAILYSLGGIRFIIALSVLAGLRFVLPIEALSNSVENFFVHYFHPDFEYDARFEYFILSGCLGFLMGYVHYHRPSWRAKKDGLWAAAGALLMLLYWWKGEPFTVYYDDHLKTEHDLAKTFWGTLYILGVQAVVISFFLWLERMRGVRLRVPVLTWVGVNSLFIFALHRLLFVKLIAPVSVLLGNFTGRALAASVWEIYIYIFITLGLCYFIKASSLMEVIFQDKNRQG